MNHPVNGKRQPIYVDPKTPMLWVLCDYKIDGNNPVIGNVVAAVDCGIVVNPDAAKNG